VEFLLVFGPMMFGCGKGCVLTLGMFLVLAVC
jgi:hypothetical protein